jgi:hypothetical protein
MCPDSASTLASILQDPVLYTRLASEISLRSYQCGLFPWQLESIHGHLGYTIILHFPRHAFFSMKNDLFLTCSSGTSGIPGVIARRSLPKQSPLKP